MQYNWENFLLSAFLYIQISLEVDTVENVLLRQTIETEMVGTEV